MNVKAIQELIRRPYSQGTTVTNCVMHSNQPITSRSDDCRLCRTDVVNVLSRALAANEFLNKWKDEAVAAFEKLLNDEWRDIRVTIKSGWGDSGRRGTALAQVEGADGMSWTLVRWDEDDEDERLGLHKSGGLCAGEYV